MDRLDKLDATVQNPSVSVVIPVYNGERFIAEAIDCILGQTFRDVEIIVVDDASVDTTGAIVRERQERVGENILRYFRNERNMERSFSRNRGAGEARGEYLFFLDYDDLWRETYLERVVEEFGRNDVDIVYSVPRTFVNENREVLRVSHKTLPTDPLLLIFSSGVGYPSATAFRRKSFSGYVGNCILREDWEIFLRAALAGISILILDQDLVLMRAHGGRTSANTRFWLSTMVVHRAHLHQVPRRYRGRFLLHGGDVCLKYGDLSGGWQLTFQALAVEPSLLLEPRVVLDLLKRGLRFDKYFRLRDQRRLLQAEVADPREGRAR